MAYNGIPGMSEDLHQDINNLDFGALFSGPLLATVNAQADAARTTLSFLQHTCLDDNSDAPTWSQLGPSEFQVFETIPRDVLLSSGQWPTEFNALIGHQGGGGLDHLKQVFSERIGLAGHYIEGSVVKIAGANGPRYFRATAVVPGTIPPPNNAYWIEVAEHNVRSMQFSYDQSVATASGNQSFNHHSVTIPLMTMVPIPYIRIESLDVDFNVKLTGVEEASRTTSNEIKVKAPKWSPKIKLGPVGHIRFKGSFSRKATRGESMKVSRSYDMTVKIHGSQAEMPAGIERMINLLEDLIVEDIKSTGN